MNTYWILFAVAIILLTMYICFGQAEHFSSKREKAQHIFDWFSTNTSPSYAEYRSDLDYRSNIVEYEDVRKLFGTKNFTVEIIENTI